MKDRNKGIDYYKIGFITLSVLVVLALILFAINWYADEKVREGVLVGQSNAISVVVNSVAANGFVTMNLPEGNLTLVPSQAISYGQEQLIVAMLDSLQTRGFIQLNLNETQLILVPYQPSAEEIAAFNAQQQLANENLGSS